MKKLLLLSLLTGVVFADPTILQAKYKDITINGKKVKVMTIEQPDGTWGYYGKAGDNFDVILQNKLDESTVIHWHGLFLPNDQDGTELTQDYIPPGAEYHYNFKLENTGTYWMHSHYELQVQDLLAAPLIIESADDSKYQQVVVMFQDYSDKPVKQIMQGLMSPDNDAHSMHGNMDMSGMEHGDMGMLDMHDMSGMDMDLNDVTYSAYLTNYHDDSSPQITQVKAGDQVKLRFINGSSSSNFWINLGKLKGSLVAVDGAPIKPITDNKFQLAMGQRSDVIVTIPKTGGNFPILGQVEGLKNQTGLILTTDKKAKKLKIPTNASKVAPALNYDEEFKLHSIESLSFDTPDQVYQFKLTGDMNKYEWAINDQMWPNVTPIKIKHGEKVEFVFDNQTMMSHPMHLHGYNFKVVSIDGKKVDGAMRDTVMVMPNSTVKVEFVADKDGKWFIHCHNLYHNMAGMMTYIEVVPN